MNLLVKGFPSIARAINNDLIKALGTIYLLLSPAGTYIYEITLHSH